MRNKQVALRRIFELGNLLNGQHALISTGRSREEVQAQLERIKEKLNEIEVLINREDEE